LTTDDNGPIWACEKIGTLGRQFTTKDTKDTKDQACTRISGFVSFVSFVFAEAAMPICS
jgi:hypothetical protein